MSKKYEELMGRISETPEMHDRVMNGVKKALEKPRAPLYLRVLPYAACFAVLLAVGAAVINLQRSQITQPPDSTYTEDMQDIQGGFSETEYASAAELSAAAGFEVSDITGLPFEYDAAGYTLLFGELAQIDYAGGGHTAEYRKARGTNDVSGDYNIYGDVVTITIDGVSVTLKGESGEYALAVWSADGCSNALSLSEGISAEQWGSMGLFG